MRTAVIILAAAAVTALAACGSSPHPAGWTADNVRVCQHYATQRDYIRNLATPSLADALKALTWIAADTQEATPGTPLRRDLDTMSAAQQNTNGPPAAVYNASGRVISDCEALGVTFKP